MAGLRPTHHCPSSSEYDTQNLKKQQLLQNTPKRGSVESLLDDDFDSWEYLTLSL